MLRRFVIIVLMLWATVAATTRMTTERVTDAIPSWNELPRDLGPWHATDAAPLAADVARVLAADQYVHRYYARDGGPAVETDLAYYRRQRVGATMHSPLNCLPGTGWTPLGTGTVTLHTSDGEATVRHVTVQRGFDRLLVLYWFQGAQRVDASEYWSRWHAITDGARGARTDAALVRVMIPIDRGGSDATAVQEAAGLATQIVPGVARMWAGD